MFSNVGGKIKGVVRGFFVINIIFSAIISIVIWNGVADWYNGFVGFLAGGVAFGIGFFFAWLLSLAAYAFGQLVENSDRIREILEDEDYTPENSNDDFTNSTPTYKTSRPKEDVYVNENGNTVTCPKCNETQPAGKSYCSICGESLKIIKPQNEEKQAFNLHDVAANTTEADDGLVCCSKCGELQKKGTNYCHICGGKLY